MTVMMTTTVSEAPACLAPAQQSANRLTSLLPPGVCSLCWVTCMKPPGLISPLSVEQLIGTYCPETWTASPAGDASLCPMSGDR